MTDDSGREAFIKATSVSRETMERLDIYVQLLRLWRPRINLVGQSTMPDLWNRHFLDSAQLFPLLPDGTKKLVDLGTGAGFPGMVLSLMGVEEVHLIESDGRKAAFLEEVAKATGAKVKIHCERIEAVKPFVADVVTSRALAALPDLLSWVKPFLGAESIALLLKGARADTELECAVKKWRFKVKKHQSITDSAAVILQLSEVSLVPDNKKPRRFT